MASIHQRLQPTHMVIAPRHDGVFDQQNRVLGGDAHQHDEPDQRRHRKTLLRKQQADERATQRQRQGAQYGDRVQKVLEQQHQYDVDAQHTGQHRQAEAGEQFTHHLGVANLHHFDARGQLFDGWQLCHRSSHIA